MQPDEAGEGEDPDDDSAEGEEDYKGEGGEDAVGEHDGAGFFGVAAKGDVGFAVAARGRGAAAAGVGVAVLAGRVGVRVRGGGGGGAIVGGALYFYVRSAGRPAVARGVGGVAGGVFGRCCSGPSCAVG